MEASGVAFHQRVRTMLLQLQMLRWLITGYKVRDRDIPAFPYLVGKRSYKYK